MYVPPYPAPYLWVVFLLVALTTALTTPGVFEPIGKFINKKWGEKDMPSFLQTGIAATTMAATCLVIFHFQGGIENWSDPRHDFSSDPTLTWVIITLAICVGLFGAALAQDLKTTTVPAITGLYFGVPALLTTTWIARGTHDTGFHIASALVETLFIHLIIRGWEYWNLRSGKNNTLLEEPQEFSLSRKYGKWVASVGGEDQVQWDDLVPKGRSWGFRAVLATGGILTGWNHRIQVVDAHGKTSEWDLSQKKEDLTFPVTEVTIPAEVMGRGDILFVFLAGLALGPFGTTGVMVTGCVITSLFALFKGKKGDEGVPFIPGLSAGLLIMIASQPWVSPYRDALHGMFGG